MVGFVAFEDSKTEAMGFLLSHIDEPTPLTKMLKFSVPEAKREKWSKKSIGKSVLYSENWPS